MLVTSIFSFFLFFFFLTLSQTSLLLRVSSTSLLKTLWEKKKLQFLLFPQCFLSFERTFRHLHQIQNCRLQTLSVWKSLKFIIWERFNSFRHKFYSSSYKVVFHLQMIYNFDIWAKLDNPVKGCI